jgi:2-polyprenyl-3-methyl-5-hydroxy-6-metoxy-1,4-benzoquinol methylase
VSELPKGAQCLDIGSGIGAYMTRLLKAGFEVQGIEPSPEMRKLAAEQGEAPRYHVEFETPSSLRQKLAAAGFRDIDVRGAMFAPLRPLHKVSACEACRGV